MCARRVSSELLWFSRSSPEKGFFSPLNFSPTTRFVLSIVKRLECAVWTSTRSPVGLAALCQSRSDASFGWQSTHLYVSSLIQKRNNWHNRNSVKEHVNWSPSQWSCVLYTDEFRDLIQVLSSYRGTRCAKENANGYHRSSNARHLVWSSYVLDFQNVPHIYAEV
ncbi:hypothetical protein AVEN_46434-1 [Araneus ventricosus]|uniref:Uncharacterized protein n=1 Tax=Araneus ventricosus TaxID=182803 RepID=A0A4Y2QPY1_ARAVE|nr:hypothetical protein AVEN_46434-1 [Araneus ventricosus]